MAKLPTGTVTFLFTDIEGSTPLWERLPAAMQASLELHNAILHHAITAEGGQVFKTIGDAFNAAFALPSQAVAAALAAQRALAAAAWGETGPLKVRMGMHTGPGVVRGNDYASNHTLIRVTRIMSAGHGGQMLLSLALAELLRGQLPQGASLKDLGEHFLKGLSQREHIFQLLVPDLPGDFPPLVTKNVPRGYQLREQIGAGGFGAVYRAFHPEVGREVAVKIILPEFANHPDFIRRFEAEAQIIARLEHPRIVPLYDYWREPDNAYLVMRLLRGGSLQSLLEQGPLPLEKVATLVEQLVEALSAAHQLGIVHRDLKPANILLDETGNFYLSDFGIAKDISLDSQATLEGSLLGSPLYMSPEQMLSQPVTPQSDIYGLGVVLYEALTGEKPFPDESLAALIDKQLHAPLPAIIALRPELPPGVDAVIQRATAKDPAGRFPDVLALAAAFRQALAGVALVAPPPQAPAVTLVNPYKGLRAFQEADAADFFGREALTERLLARLGEDGPGAHFLAVVGPSGSGKSSLVKAGLIPALRRGSLSGSDAWYIVEMTPRTHPFEEVEASLLRIAVNPPQSLFHQLREDERGFLRAVKRSLPTEDSQLLLVIDQFEEVFTLVEDENEARQFLDSLYAAVSDAHSPLRAVLTLRADFYDRPLMYPDFSTLVQDRTEVVVPMTASELERSILSPAQRVGVGLETGLVTEIVTDVVKQPGALPLLQYALTELFERRSDHLLTQGEYQALGGVEGVLGKRAEEIYSSLDEPGQALAQQSFLRLVTLGEGAEDTRRRALRSELEAIQIAPTNEGERPAGDTGGNGSSPDHRPPSTVIGSVLDAFGRARLLSFDRDPQSRAPTVEVAHEALLREWRRLREWLDASRADLRMQRVLANAAADWSESGEEASFLLRGARLDQFEAWMSSTGLALTQNERTFLEACLVEREARRSEEAARQARERTLERRSRNFLRGLVGVLAVAALVAVLLSLFAFNQQRVARQNEAAAAESAATAQAARDDALNAEATAEAEGLRAEGEKQIAVSRELASAALNNFEVDPERSILLALHGLSQAYTREAEEALHRAVQTLRVQFTLRGHESPINSIAYSLDGMRLASAGDDGLVKVWDTASGKELFTLKGHTSWVGDVAFSPDGTRLASAGGEGDDAIVKVWDAASGKELFTLKPHTSVVDRVAFSPDGARLVTAGGDGDDVTAKIWDASSGKELFTLRGHTEWVSVAFSPDGARLVTAGGDGVTKIWDATTGRELLTIPGEGFLDDVAFSPDGTKLATTLKVWNAANGQELFTLSGHTSRVFGVDFSPDGSQLATASADNTVKLWDAASGRELLTLGGHTNFILDVKFSPDGAHLATAGIDQTVRIWDISPAGSREILTLTIDGVEFWNIAFSPDENRFITASSDKIARVWNAAIGQELLVLSGHSDTVYSAAFSPDGKRIVTSSADNTVKLWDAATGKELLTLSGHGEGTVGPYPGVLDVAFSPDGTKIVTAGADGVAKLWDAVTGNELLSLSGHTAGLTNVAFSPDGTKIVTASGDPDQTARVWDAMTGKELLTLHQGDRIWELAFSPDGGRLVSGGNGGIVKMWDVASGQELMNFVGHTSTVGGAEFSPDGSRLVTSGGDGTIRIWNVETGEELLTLTGQGTVIRAVLFSRDGSRLVSASADGTARILVVRLEDLITLAKSRVTRSLTDEECQKYLHVAICPAVP